LKNWLVNSIGRVCPAQWWPHANARTRQISNNRACGSHPEIAGTGGKKRAPQKLDAGIAC
jgi:hypothetical protein